MRGFTVAGARTVLAAAAGVLCAAHGGGGAALADAPDGGMETTHGPSLITIDNSNADSWLEVDRTLNVLAPLSRGTAGSDHDGGGGAVEQHVSGPSNSRLQAAPVERGDEEEEEEEDNGKNAAGGGDDPEGDADRDRAGRVTSDAPPEKAGSCASGASAPQEERAACSR